MKGFVYILTNKNNSALYTGVTSNLKDRIEQHKGRKHPESYSARYNCNKLVYYEVYDSIVEAIEREKIIKGGSRKKKLDLIDSTNPGWTDLSSDFCEG